MFWLLWLVIAAPFVELAGLLYLGRQLGVGATLALVAAAALAGVWLIRRQGLRTARRVQEDLSAGRMPGEALVDGALMFLAGVLLLFPGVITDVIGLTLLIPACRRLYWRALSAWFRRRFQVTTLMTRDEERGARSEVIDARVLDRDPPAD